MGRTLSSHASSRTRSPAQRRLQDGQRTDTSRTDLGGAGRGPPPPPRGVGGRAKPLPSGPCRRVPRPAREDGPGHCLRGTPVRTHCFGSFNLPRPLPGRCGGPPPPPVLTFPAPPYTRPKTPRAHWEPRRVRRVTQLFQSSPDPPHRRSPGAPRPRRRVSVVGYTVGTHRGGARHLRAAGAAGKPGGEGGALEEPQSLETGR